jgi:pseudaminic acid biosynthesis-associated methylase
MVSGNARSRGTGFAGPHGLPHISSKTASRLLQSNELLAKTYCDEGGQGLKDHPALTPPKGSNTNRLPMTIRSQDKFWLDDYGSEYVQRNRRFDNILGREAWATILAKASLADKTYLEVGCNIGRNLDQLKLYDIDLKPSAIEVNPKALEFVKSRHCLQQDFCGPAQEASCFKPDSFELVFTSGVLIHIHPDDLLSVMEKLFLWSSKYVVLAEYFNRTPISVEYQGRNDVLFKRDFGGLFMDSFDVKLVDYGFLWGRIYDTSGFDDVTWWLFRKN